MANMIIKPAADGNLLIQDRAGGAVLSTSTSGATIANAVQDNITRLGTIASGTLGSGVTFPAGMVIKEQAFDEVSYIAAGSTTFASGNTMSFTKLKASADSYIVYIWNGYIGKYTNSGSYADWRMGYTPSGGSIAYTEIRTHDNNNNSPSETRIYYPMCIQYYISTLNAGTHTFVFQTRWGGGTNNNTQLVTDAEQYVFIKEISK